MQSTGGNDKTSEWMNKLMGKKIGDSSNETVKAFPSYSIKESRTS